MTTDLKPTIVAELETLRLNEQQEGNVFKARAYAKVLAGLRVMEGPVRTMADLEGVEGIGARIRTKIQEILETGALAAAAVVRREGVAARKELFMTVYGIGPVKAAELVRKKNPVIMDLADLRAAAAEDPDLLNEKQTIGLKHAEDSVLRIPRAEMDRHAARVTAVARAVSEEFIVEVVGSYRRGAADSGDIDVLLTLPAGVTARRAGALFKQVCERLGEGEPAYVSDVLAQGPKKYMAFCRLEEGKPYRRLDLLLTPAAEYPYAVLYFTGSDKFNVAMRQRALDKGYTLNEHGMKPVAAVVAAVVPPVPVMRTERDIFDFLGITWREPADRNTAVL